MPNKEDKVAVTTNDITRVLLLDGEKGSVACRVHGSEIANPFPHLSSEKTIETSFRSRIRLQNLIAVRGAPGKGMVGPADYFGNWECPEKYFYSIEINSGFPTIYKHTKSEPSPEHLRQIRQDEITEIRAQWISGTDKEAIKKKRTEYQNYHSQLTGDSLFVTAGILEIEEEHHSIELKRFDAATVDLTPFKARLVKNNIPFKISAEPIHHSDEWRAVSYHYE